MGGARTILEDAAARPVLATGRTRVSHLVLGVVLLVTMTVAEVQFLRYVAGPESVNMIMAAEGVAAPD